jgi:hypothetical protein
VSHSEGIPLELRVGLRAGSVYYFIARELSSAEPHYFVVVNRQPLVTALMLMVVFSSQVEKVRLRNRERPQTVVEIAPSEYPDLTRLSAIDCNVVFRRSVLEMTEMIRQRIVGYHRDLPKDLLAKVRAAILASPVIDPADKDLV